MHRGDQVRRRVARAAGAAALLGVALAACSSSTKGPSRATTPASAASQVTTAAPTTTAQLVGPPVKVMQIYDGTGPAATPEVTEGAQAAVKAVNASGGINHHPLSLVECNTSNDPNAAANCGRSAVADGVVALVGSSTQYASEFLPDMVAHTIADLGAEPAGIGDFTSPASFPIVGGPIVTIATLPYFLAASGHKQIALVRPDLPPAAISAQLANTVLKPFGIKVTGDVAVPVSAPDLAPYVASATGTGIDGVVSILPGEQAVTLVQSVRAKSPGVTIGFEVTDIAGFLKALGSQTAGLVGAADFVPLSNDVPANQRYRAEMKAAGYADLSGFRQDAWLAVHVFADVAAGLPTVTAPALYDLLNHTSGLRTGLTPPLQWETGGVGGVPRVFNACEMEVTYDKAGAATAVNGNFVDAFTNAPCPSP